MIKTEAIVLSSIQYGETGKILKCYTQKTGIQSFFVKGTHSKKQKISALFHPLTQIEVVYKENKNKSLNHFSEVRQSRHYINLHSQAEKTCIALFLAEILHSVLKEEEYNPKLYEFLQNSFLKFDENKNSFADFHLWFLLNLTVYLGFYPNIDFDSKYFDLVEGISTDANPGHFFVEGEDLKLLEQLIQLDFFEQTENIFNQNQRKSLIDLLLKYYELHISDFRPPKSLEVLTVIFN